MFSNFKYFLVEGFRSFWKNKIMSLASVIVVSIALLLLGSYFIVNQNAHSIENQLRNMYEIQVFIDRNATSEKITAIGDEIKQIDNVKTTVYFTKEEALEEFKNNWQDGAPLLEGMESENNPLRNSYKITLKDISKIDDTIAKISSISGVQKVKNNRESLKFIFWTSNFLKTASIWATVVFAIISFFLISNTIRIAMVSRKREVEILKYIGATNNFIRTPFLIEGLIIGILGAAIAYFGLYFIYQILYLKMENFFAGSMHAVSINSLSSGLAIVLFIFGPIIGAIGSGWSIKKYLDV